MDWALVRGLLRLLHDEVRAHRRRLQLLLLFWLLHRVWKPLVRQYARRLHRLVASETPRLHYQRTPENERLLAPCTVLTQEQYCPPWPLVNGHLQTLQLSREPKEAFPAFSYERQTLDMPDRGILSLDWLLPPRADASVPRVSELDPATPTMLMLPGLTGGSGEFYIRCVAHLVAQQGWQVVVMNARGCADTPLKTAQLFCCAYTDDLRHVLELFRTQFDFVANSALVAVGFSMGSNVLVKYLGEEQEHARARVTAGVSVGNPFDLVACAAHLKSTPFYRATYDKALNGNLQELFFRKSNAHEVFRLDPRIDIAAVRAAQSLTQFDDRLTRRIFDYDSVHAYYSDASSSTRVASVCVPLLCLNAEDDPISVKTSIPYAQARENPHVILCVTKQGGHLGFYEDTSDAQGREDPTRVKAWAARVIAQFAQSVWTRQQELREKRSV